MSDTLCADQPIPSLYTEYRSPGFSRDAADCWELIRKVVGSIFCDSWSLTTKTRETSRLIGEVLEERRDDDGAFPLSDEALNRALEFSALFPDDLPIPEISASDSGEVMFDWIEDRDKMFTVAIDESGQVSFAWTNGAASGHGSYIFTDFLDPRIPSNIREIMC